MEFWFLKLFQFGKAGSGSLLDQMVSKGAASGYKSSLLICASEVTETCSEPPGLTALSGADWNWHRYSSEKRRVRDHSPESAGLRVTLGKNSPWTAFLIWFFFFYSCSFTTSAGIWNRHCQNTVKTVIQCGSRNLGRSSRCPTIVRTLCQISTEVWDTNTTPTPAKMIACLFQKCSTHQVHSLLRPPHLYCRRLPSGCCTAARRRSPARLSPSPCTSRWKDTR